MTAIGNVLTSAQKNFEINSQAEGGDLAATVSALNNIWSEFNNLNADNSKEAVRSVLLAAMDVYDIFSKSTNHNMVNNGVRFAALIDRLRINIGAFNDALDPSFASFHRCTVECQTG
jgi:hypothetical protein